MDRPKLYINGVEFPVISIATSFTIGGGITISASFPPSVALANILPGSDVVIVLVSDEDKSKTRVFTEGRIVGVNHSESVGAMSAQLQIVSPYNSVSSTLIWFIISAIQSGVMKSVLGYFLLPFFETLPPPDTKGTLDCGSQGLLVLKTLKTNTNGVDDNQSSLVGKDNIGQTFIRALKCAMSENGYLKRFNKSYHLPERFFSLTEDMHLSEEGYSSLVQYMLQNQLKSGSPEMPLSSFIEFFANLLGIAIIPVPIMPGFSSSGAPHQYLIMPDAYAIVPPETNVVYPYEIISLTFSRSFINQITREIGIFNGTASGATGDQVAVQPEVLHDLYNSVPTDSDSRDAFITPKILPEEDFIGLHGKETQLSYMLNNGTDPDNIVNLENKSKSYFGFQFNKDVLSASSLTVTVPFKPEILLGFPLYVLTARGSFIGIVSSVTHAYDYSGSAITNISLSYVRSALGARWLQYTNNITQVGANYYPGSQSDPDDLYKGLFGINSVLSLDSSLRKNDHSTHFSIINGIRAAYNKWLLEVPIHELAVRKHTHRRKGISWEDYKRVRAPQTDSFGVSWNDRGYTKALTELSYMLSGAYSVWDDEAGAKMMAKSKENYLNSYISKNSQNFPNSYYNSDESEDLLRDTVSRLS